MNKKTTVEVVANVESFRDHGGKWLEVQNGWCVVIKCFTPIEDPFVLGEEDLWRLDGIFENKEGAEQFAASISDFDAMNMVATIEPDYRRPVFAGPETN